MANSTYTQAIKVPVELVLKDAQDQALNFKKIVQEMVKPDTSSYKELTRLFDELSRKAGELRSSLSTAFSTSSSSDTFLKKYLAYFNRMQYAVDELRAVSGKDLILSDKESEKIKIINERINELQKSIKDIQGLKIETLFKDGAEKEFEQIKKIAEEFKISLKGLSATDFIDKITSQIKTMEERLESATKKAQELQALSEKFNGKKIEEVVPQDLSGLSGISNFIDVNKMDETSKAVRSVYTELQELTKLDPEKVSISKFFSGGSADVDKIIKEQTTRINNALNAQIEEIQKKKEILEQSLELTKRVLSGKKYDEGESSQGFYEQAKGLILNSNLFDESIIPEATGRIKDTVKILRDKINEELATLGTDNQAMVTVREGLQEKFAQAFSGIDMEAVVSNAKAFKQSLGETLAGSGVDINSAGIVNFINSIQKGDNVSNIFNNMTAAIQNFITTVTTDAENAVAALENIKNKVQELEQVKLNVGGAVSGSNENVAKLQSEIETLKSQIADLEKQLESVKNVKVESQPGFTQMAVEAGKAGDAIRKTSLELQKFEQRQKALGEIQTAIKSWMGFRQVLNLTKRAVKSMASTIKELDSVMTQIAVVTNMTQQDLWGQMSTYSAIAQKYGVAIKGVYEVSQIFYQQGLQTADVMKLSEETLKMARIAGIDYGTAADYMTTAIRGFKMEMSEANRVTDVFSSLAAHTASDTEELAVAMSKTASSMESVGASFESTSAMIATMVSVTRESATNIGSALKSIAARYGEMKADPSALKDSEGEDMSLNKVDTALKTIGISIQDVNHQFRDFDDVILELGEKWNTIDKNAQRYIATVMAGNRQQSRFLALVSNIDQYKNALALAENAAGSGDAQINKTLDSIETKMERLKVSLQQFYASSGLEQLFKKIVDKITGIFDTFNRLPKLFDSFPAYALTFGFNLIRIVKNMLMLLFTEVKNAFNKFSKQSEGGFVGYLTRLINRTKAGARKAVQDGADAARDQAKQEENKDKGEPGGSGVTAATSEGSKTLNTLAKIAGIANTIAQTVGAILQVNAASAYANSRTEDEDRAAATNMRTGAIISTVGSTISSALMGAATGAASGAGLAGGIIGALVGIGSGIISNIGAFRSADQMGNVTNARRLELAQKRQEEATQRATNSKKEVQDIKTSIDEYKRLEEARYSSNEAMEEYLTYSDQMLNQYPELIKYINSEGAAILDLGDAYNYLAQKALQERLAEVSQAQSEIETAKSTLAEVKNPTAVTHDFTKYNSEVKKEWTDYSREYRSSSNLMLDSNYIDRKNGIIIFKEGFFNNDIDTQQLLNEALTRKTTTEENRNQYQISGDYWVFDSSTKDGYNINDLRAIANSLWVYSQHSPDEYIKQVGGFYNSEDFSTYNEEQLIEAITRMREAWSLSIDKINDEVEEAIKKAGTSQRELSSLKRLSDAAELSGEELYKLIYDKQYKQLMQRGEQYFYNGEDSEEVSAENYDNFIRNLLKYDQEKIDALFKETLFSSSERFIDYLTSQGIDKGVAKAAASDLKKVTEEQRAKLNEAITNAYSFAGNKGFESLFDNEDDNLDLGIEYINDLTKDLEIASNTSLITLRDKYVKAIHDFYFIVGNIDDIDLQTALMTLYRSTDHYDYNSIQSMIDSIKEMDGYEDNISNSLYQTVVALENLQKAVPRTLVGIYDTAITKAKEGIKKIEEVNKKIEKGYSGFDEVLEDYAVALAHGYDDGLSNFYTKDFEGNYILSASGAQKMTDIASEAIEADLKQASELLGSYNDAADAVQNTTLDEYKDSAGETKWVTDPKSAARNFKINIDSLKNENEEIRKNAEERLLKSLSYMGITDENMAIMVIQALSDGAIQVGETYEEFQENIIEYFKGLASQAQADIEVIEQEENDTKLSEDELAKREKKQKADNLVSILKNLPKKGDILSEKEAAKYGRYIETDANGVVTDVYKDRIWFGLQGYYEERILTADQLNQADEDFFNYINSKQQAALSLLNNVTKISRNTLSQILSDAGNKNTLSTYLDKDGKVLDEYEDMIERIGEDEYVITNPEKFLEAQGIDLNDPIYTSALSAARDALIQFNETEKKNIESELNSLSSGKAGQEINLTFLSKKLGDEMAGIFAQFGEYADGILELDKDVTPQMMLAAIKNDTDGLKTALTSAGIDVNEFIIGLKTSIEQKLSNAFSELKIGGVLSESTTAFLKKDEIWKDKVNDEGQIVLTTVEDYIAAHIQLLENTSGAYHNGEVSLESANSAFMQAWKATHFKKTSMRDMVQDIGSGNFTLESLGNNLGINLTDYFDINTGELLPFKFNIDTRQYENPFEEGTFKFDEFGNIVSINFELLEKSLQNMGKSLADAGEYVLAAQVEQNNRIAEKETPGIVKKILSSNRDKFTLTGNNAADLAKLFGIPVDDESYDKLMSALSGYENTDGSYNLTNYLYRNFARFDKETQKIITEYLIEDFENLTNNATSNISTVLSGFSSQAEAMKFFKDNKIKGTVTYDEELNKWMTDESTLKRLQTQYLRNQAKYYKTLGKTTAEASILARQDLDNLIKQNAESLRSEINTSSYMSSGSEKDRKKLLKQIDYYNKLYGDTQGKIDVNIEDLLNGGIKAVKAIETIYGDKTTDAQREQAYKNQLTAYENAIKLLEEGLKEETYVADERLREILSKAGVEFDSNGVVVTVNNMIETYSSLYDSMRDTAIATTEELNSQYVKILEAEDALNVGAESLLINGFGMSYSDLQGIIDNVNKATGQNQYLEDVLNYDGIERTGYGTVNILDFDTVMKQILGSNFDRNSYEYVSALKTYNDGLIEYNNRVKNAISNELSGLKDIRIGDQLNITQFMDELKNFETNGIIPINASNVFKARLKALGVDITNGVLEVTDKFDGNIVNLLKVTKEELQKINIDHQFDAEIASLNESIKNVFSSIVGALDSYTPGMTISKEIGDMIGYTGYLNELGEYVITNAQDYIFAAQKIHDKVNESFMEGAATLKQLNDSYAQIITGNNVTQNASLTLLQSADNLTLDAINNFATATGRQLEEIINESGEVTSFGSNYFKKTGINKYQIKSQEAFEALTIGLDKRSEEYIDLYTNYIKNTDTTGVKSNLLKDLLGNYDKLTTEQLGQLAKTFNTSVEFLMQFITQNADGTWNAQGVLNTWGKYYSDEKFQEAFDSMTRSYISSFSDALLTYATSNKTPIDEKTLEKAYKELGQNLAGVGQQVTYSIEKLKNRVSEGGVVAVQLFDELYRSLDQQLSADQVSSLYRGITDDYISAIEKIESTPGAIVDEVTANIINVSGGAAEQLGETGQYVVTSAADLYRAYRILLKRLEDQGTATLEELNNLTAKALENKDGQQDAIDALSNAAGMTYSEFGEILTKQGIRMTEHLIKNLEDADIIQSMGGNKMRILDFSSFASVMNWETGSEEYVSAFKAYNDSMIELNRKAEKSIFEEVKAIGTAKGGDWLNLTQLMDTLNKEVGPAATLILNESLNQFGGRIEDGILKLDSDANISAIIQQIASTAQKYGGLLSSEMAELADTLADVLKGYVDLIKGGISGTLSNSQAQGLQQWADQFNIKLDFTKTKEGLKLSTDQAFALYQQLKQIDELQAQLVFDELASSMLNDKGGDFTSASKMWSQIKQVQEEIADIQALQIKQANNLNEADRKRLASLKEQEKELQAIAQQMKYAQMDNPASYNFMSNSLPENMNAPLNYWNSVGSAYKAINAANTSEYIEVQDFYNIVNELNNLAGMGQDIEFLGVTLDGSLESASALIENGMLSLSNIDGEGTKISLEKLGSNLEIGAANMGVDFSSAVDAMADSQIEMIDAMIAMLELVVAMEDLGSLDQNGNGLEFGEMFDPISDGVFKANQSASDLAKKLQKDASTNEELQKILEETYINGENLNDILTKLAKQIDLTETEAQIYFTALKALSDMANSGDYDLDNLASSIQEIIAGSGLSGSIITVSGVDIGVDLNGNVFTIDWSEDTITDLNKKIADFFHSDKNSMNKEELQKLFQNYITGNLIDTGEKLKAEALFSNVEIQTEIDESGAVVSWTVDSVKYDTEGAALAAVYHKKEASRSGVTSNGIISDDGTSKTESFTLEGGAQYTLTTIITDDGVTTLYKGDLQGPKGSTIHAIGETYEEFIENYISSYATLEGRDPLSLTPEERQDIIEVGHISATPVIKVNVNPTNKEWSSITHGDKQDLINKFLGGYYKEFEESSIDLGLSVNMTIDETGQIPEEQWQQIAEFLGITSENKVVNLAINAATGSDPELLALVTAPSAQPLEKQMNVDLTMTGELGENFITSLNNLDGDKLGLFAFKVAAIAASMTQIQNTSFSNVDDMKTKWDEILKVLEDVKSIMELLSEFDFSTPTKPTVSTPTTTPNISPQARRAEEHSQGGGQKKEVSTTTIDTSPFAAAIQNIATVIAENTGAIGLQGVLISSGLGAIGASVKNFPLRSNAPALVDGLAAAMKNIPSGIASRVNTLASAMNNIPSKSSLTLSVVLNLSTTGAKGDVAVKGVVSSTGNATKLTNTKVFYKPFSKGNVALAAGRRTLMGELGPELVVSNGRYFVVGENGAEFVDLAPDAIVFNHLQTRKLLANGTSGRGKPVTNEHNATSFATGNAGPAMASARAALATLKELRAMWQALRDASPSDLGSKAGSGSGGGGGGGGGGERDNTGYIHDLERWYNLLRQIDHLETHITYEEQLQSRIESDREANGKAIYNSYKKELQYLQQEINANKTLAQLQKDYYDRRREDLNSSNYGKIFTFNEDGLMQYNDPEEVTDYINSLVAGISLDAVKNGTATLNGNKLHFANVASNVLDDEGNIVYTDKNNTKAKTSKRSFDIDLPQNGLDILATLNATDVNGKPLHTAEEQLAILQALGFGDEIKYDSSGKEIKDDENKATNMVKSFWDHVDGWMDELDGLYDSYHEQAEKVQENTQKLNEVMQKLIDNELEVEQAILNAIEKRQQQEIDNLKDEKDALNDSVNKFVTGLNDQLTKEKEMYDNQQNARELTKLQRQLAILQRSGGSASQIRSLQQQISTKQQDEYFNKQQEQIDAVKEASDKQIQRMDYQINLMTETLDYQKEHGLLWAEVRDIMKLTPEQIISFVQEHNPDYASNSALQIHEDLKELTNKIEVWTSERDDQSPFTRLSDLDDALLRNADGKLPGSIDLSNEEDKQAFINKYKEIYAETGDPVAAEEIAKKAAEASKQEREKSAQPVNNGNTATVPEPEKIEPKKFNGYVISEIGTNLKKGSSGAKVKALQSALIDIYGKAKSLPKYGADGQFGSETESALKKFQTEHGIKATGILDDATRKVFASLVPPYKTGGLVDYTGLAMLHGSSQKPEAVLNAEQTDFLTGGFWDAINEWQATLNKVASIAIPKAAIEEVGETINIQELNVNMMVKSIDNDYDARRAANIAMDEMVKIARKSGQRSVSRR